MAINTEAVQKLYVAYFSRPADPAGLAYWEGQLGSTAASQAQLTTLAASGFSASAEYAALYAGQTNAQIVNSLYVNLFGRAAEPVGLAYWTARLETGTETFASLALQLVYSAQGSDVTAITNKVAAAAAFTTAVNLPAEIAGYAGTDAASSARSWLATVTDVAATLTAATDRVDTAVSDAVAAGNGGGSGGGSTAFTLTTSSPIVTEVMVGDAITKAMTFTLTLGSALTTDVTVNYATQTTGTAASGTDFVAATGSVTFAAGQTVANVSIVVNADAIPEGDETVVVVFSGTGLASPVTGTGTILANDTTGITVALTAAPDSTASLGLAGSDDSISGTIDQNTPAGGTLQAGDIFNGGDGTDTLTLTPIVAVALTLDDLLFAGVTGMDRIVINTTTTGAQTITTGANFNAAFGAEGLDLQTTSTTGAMTINTSAFTGATTLTVITDASIGGNFITTGAGVATVTATSTTGPLTINSAASVLATVNATSTTGFVNVTTGSGADSVTVTTGNALGGNVITTGAGNDTIDVRATTATTSGNTITGGLGADTLKLSGNTSPDRIVIGNTDSGITTASADSITGFATGIDFLRMGTVADSTPASGNYVEADAGVADFAAALVAANNALTTLAGTSPAAELYAFQWDGSNGYLFNDTNGDGTANQVIVLVGITGTMIASADIIA